MEKGQRPRRQKIQPDSPTLTDSPTVTRRPLRRQRTISVIILATIAALAVVMVTIAVVPHLIPASRYRGWIEGVLAEKIDARVVIEKFRIRLLPFPSYTITGLSLISKEEPFKGLEIFHADRISGGFSVIEFLRGTIVADVKMHGAATHLRISDGRFNLDALGMGIIQKEAVSAKRDVIVNSVNMSNGRFDIWDKNSLWKTVDGIEMTMTNLSFANGVAADILMNGHMLDPVFANGAIEAATMDVGIAGPILLDIAKSELSSRGLKVHFGPSQFVTDFLVNYGATPSSFNVHAASPNTDPSALMPFARHLLPLELPSLSWVGLLAADLSINGTREVSTASIQVDATAANISVGEFFRKVAGLPLKGTFSLLARPEAITLNKGNLTLGQDDWELSGEILRGVAPALQLAAKASGLSDGTLKTSFPKLSLLDKSSELDVSLEIKGPISDKWQPGIGGDFKIKSAAVAGIDVTDLSGSFTWKEEGETPGAVFFPMVRAAFANGQLSGNGTLRFGEITDATFDLVVDRVDPKIIPAQGGMIDGEASMVVKAQATGNDAEAMAQSLKLSGSFLVRSGSWAKTGPATQIFSAETLGEFESATHSKPVVALAEKMVPAKEEIKDLDASFTMADNALTISRATWTSPLYDADVAATVDQSGMTSGNGKIWLPKTVALKILPTPADQKKLLDGKGRLFLPVTIKGKVPEITFNLDKEKFSSLTKEKAPPPSPPGPTKVIRPGEVAPDKSMPVKEEAQAPAEGTPVAEQVTKEPVVKKKALTPTKKKAPRKSPKEPIARDQEDILKVIIGR